jgi:hypothetical protein
VPFFRVNGLAGVKQQVATCDNRKIDVYCGSACHQRVGFVSGAYGVQAKQALLKLTVRWYGFDGIVAEEV